MLVSVTDFAGHDTTANTLAFTMALLATQPEIQDWVAEEVRDVVAYQSDDWEYSNLYPRLLRCRAVLVSKLTRRVYNKLTWGSMKHCVCFHPL